MLDGGIVEGLRDDRAEHGDDARLHHDGRGGDARDAAARAEARDRGQLQPRGGGWRRIHIIGHINQSHWYLYLSF